MEVLGEQPLAVEIRLVELEVELPQDGLGPLQILAPQQRVDVALESPGEPRPLHPQSGALEQDEGNPRRVEPGESLAQLLVAAQVVHGRGEHPLAQLL